MHVLVTGAAGAIGAALARAFARRHPAATFSLVDVEQTATEALTEELTDAEALCWDLSRVEALPDLTRALMAERGPVDVLVNCAGIMEMTSFNATRWEVASRLLDIDLTSPLRLMNLLVPPMVERGRGGVINVTSMAGVTPIVGCSYYGAAKAGLAMASEIARIELRQHGVQVVTVYPGPVRSGLERRARAQLEPSVAARWMPTGDAAPLADRIVHAYEKGQARVVYPPLYDVAHRFPRVAGWLTTRLSPTPRA